jgi:D-alanine transaminase
VTAPLPICYLNGAYLPLVDARISPLDRGFLFADAVYEVMPVYAGRPFRFVEHFARLRDSLAAIRLRDPLSDLDWRELTKELIARNGGGDLYIYLQVSRGADTGRNPAPLPDLHTVFAFCAPWPAPSPNIASHGIAAITAADIRWARCDIKAVGLLPNILLRQQAVDAGAAETLLLRDGFLTEATSAAAHVVMDGVLLTPPPSHQLLLGTTRGVVELLADRIQLPRRAAAVSDEQLRRADEILISSALREVLPVTMLDGRKVGTGAPGPVWRRLRVAFDEYRAAVAAEPW